MALQTGVECWKNYWYRIGHSFIDPYGDKYMLLELIFIFLLVISICKLICTYELTESTHAWHQNIL